MHLKEDILYSVTILCKRHIRFELQSPKERWKYQLICIECMKNLDALCGQSCSAPPDYQLVVGTIVQLACNPGYASSTKGTKISAECKKNAEKTSSWSLSDTCASIDPFD